MNKLSPSQAAWQRKGRPVPRMTFEGWCVVVAFLGLCLEGFMKLWVETQLQNGTAFWSRFTPFKMFPSESFFYTVGLVATIYSFSSHSAFLLAQKWLKLAMGLLFIGACSALYGYISTRSESGLLAFSSFKISYFRLCFLPWFFMVFLRIPFLPVVERIFWGSSFIALISIAGSMNLAQLHFSSEVAPNFTGSQLLLLPAIYGFYKSCATRQPLVIMNTLLLFAGVLLPLQKPALVTAALGLLLSVSGMMYLMQKNRLARMRISFGASTLMGIFTLMILCSGFAIWIVTSDGAGLTYIEQRFLKTNYTGFDQDVSSGRLEIWSWALHEFFRSPLWGQGLGNAFETLSSKTGSTVRATHNEYLEILQSGGLIAFVPYMIFLYMVLKSQLFLLRRVPPELIAVAGAIFSWSMAMLLSNSYGSVTSVQSASFVFWAVVAASFAMQLRLKMYYNG